MPNKNSKKKDRKDPGVTSDPEPMPSTRIPNEEDDWDEIGRNDEDEKRIPVPPGEEPPYPIQAPTQPGPKTPAYV